MPNLLDLNPALGTKGAFAREGCETLQRNLLLAFLPYVGTPLKGTGVESQTRKRIQAGLEFLKAAIGPWKLVWGPGVFQPKTKDVAANTVFVAEHQETGELFVSIAGTNPFSAYAWFQEDFAITETVRWQYGDAPQEAAISMATEKGVLALQGIVPRGGVGKNLSLQNFFERRFANGGDSVDVTVSGHSLGGALSPAIGLWLLDTRKNWDIHDRASIEVYAFAGPTPGNEEFASYISDRFGSRLHRVANPYDAAVHAWNVGDMAEMKALYTPDIPRDAFFDQFGNFAINKTSGIRYQQIGLTPTILAGSVNKDIVSPYLPSMLNLMTQILYQHTVAYFELIGVPYLQKEKGIFDHVLREIDHVVHEVVRLSGAPWFVASYLKAATAIAAWAFSLLPKSWTR